MLLLSAPALGAVVAVGRDHALAAAEHPAEPGDRRRSAGAACAAVVAADDGTIAPPPHTRAASSAPTGRRRWSAPGSLPHAGSTSAGQADVAWGIDERARTNVYAVELGSSGGEPLHGRSGVVFSVVGRRRRDSGPRHSPVDPGHPTSARRSSPRSPSTARSAASTSRSRARLGTGPAAAARPTARRSGSRTPTSRRPASAALDHAPRVAARASDPRTTAAPRSTSCPAAASSWRSATTRAPGPQIETRDLRRRPRRPAACHYCGPANGAPSARARRSATRRLRRSSSGVVGAPTPERRRGRRSRHRRLARERRRRRARVRRDVDGRRRDATGRHSRSTRRAPGNQVAPELAATGSAGASTPPISGIRAPAACRPRVVSAGPPLAGRDDGGLGAARRRPGRRGELVERRSPARPRRSAGASASRRRARPRRRARCRPPSSRSPIRAGPGTRTCTSSGLLHGTTARRDRLADRDGVQERHHDRARERRATTTAIRSPGRSARSRHTPARASPSPTPRAATSRSRRRTDVGSDTFEAIATDGVPGHEARALINVNVVNDPPRSYATSLVAREDTPLDDPGRGLRERSERRPADRRPHRRDGRHRRARRRAPGASSRAPTARAPGSFVLHASTTATSTPAAAVRRSRSRSRSARSRSRSRTRASPHDRPRHGAALRGHGRGRARAGTLADHLELRRRHARRRSGSNVAHRFRRRRHVHREGVGAGRDARSIKVGRARAGPSSCSAPRASSTASCRCACGRASAGKLSMRRGQPLAHDRRARRARTAQTLEHPGDDRAARPPHAAAATRTRRRSLPALTLRRLVLVSPLSAG